MGDRSSRQRDRAREADVERFVYGGPGRGLTQRSPIMLDVWSKFALEGPGPQDLLLIAKDGHTAGEVAQRLAQRLRADAPDGAAEDVVERARIAAIQTAVAAWLSFRQVIRALLPMTEWYRTYLFARIVRENGKPSVEACDPAFLFAGAAPPTFEQAIIEAIREQRAGVRTGTSSYLLRDDLLWLARIAGGIAHLHTLAPHGAPSDEQWSKWLEERDRAELVVPALFALLRDVAEAGASQPLWAVHDNRPAMLATRKSTCTIKADAARHVFDVTGKGIRWAVLDCGIDATHTAFLRRDDGAPRTLPSEGSWSEDSRVTCTYDFTQVRDLMALTPGQLDEYPTGVPPELRDRLTDQSYRDRLRRALVAMVPADHSAERPPIDWIQWGALLRIDHAAGRYRRPKNEHGTHVAGIIGADWRVGDSLDDVVTPEGDTPERMVARTGVCPEIELWDLRVLDDAGASSEFPILAALQFVRAINAQHEHQEIHGVNLSFSLISDVRKHACGGTPVCIECDRLVASGVVTVAAAGNLGRARYVEDTGAIDEGYRMASITDPGNAAGVITVGATNRVDPHTYGVSYFSSRGPTGDGRAKPDLVAPGEKITSTAPNNTEVSLTGTSAAAPHVSGAAALLLCRYPELLGHPAEIKRILRDTATDLGRDRYCQGAGLVDILRAMESV